MWTGWLTSTAWSSSSWSGRGRRRSTLARAQAWAPLPASDHRTGRADDPLPATSGVAVAGLRQARRHESSSGEEGPFPMARRNATQHADAQYHTQWYNSISQGESHLGWAKMQAMVTGDRILGLKHVCASVARLQDGSGSGSVLLKPASQPASATYDKSSVSEAMGLGSSALRRCMSCC